MRHKPPRLRRALAGARRLRRAARHRYIGAHPEMADHGESEEVMPRKKKMPAKRGTKNAPKAAASARAPKFRQRSATQLAGRWFAKLVALQARLRSPNGCPWDREQTHQSLRQISRSRKRTKSSTRCDSGDPREFSSELGDLLLQVVFHANPARGIRPLHDFGRDRIRARKDDSPPSARFRRREGQHSRRRAEELGTDQGRGACHGTLCQGPGDRILKYEIARG